jgi:cell pole-organizing protein PopZ
MNQAKTPEEPSIEEILGSIRRIIADDDEQPQTTATAPNSGYVEDNADEDDDEPLELTQKIDEDGTIIDMHDDDAALSDAMTASPSFAQTLEDEIIMIDETEQSPAASFSDPLVSQTAAAATAAVMAKLARNTSINRQGNEGATLEDLVKEMIRPMLSEWLDHNLPRLVQSMVERELDKISRRVG